MTLITQSENPSLWAALQAVWLAEDEPGYIVVDNQQYKVLFEIDDTECFLEQDTYVDLLDSRSFLRSKATTYKKLDDGEF